MPLYEFQCSECGTRGEVFTRTVQAEVDAPACPQAGPEGNHRMTRIVSAFARRLTLADQLAEAEAKFGNQVDAVMGQEPDVGRFARRYDSLAKNLPAPDDV